MDDRRTFVRRLLVVGAVATAGCLDESEETVTGPVNTPTDSPSPTGSPSPTESPESTPTGTASPTVAETEPGTETGTADATQVAVGPEGRLRFDPETVEVAVGETVRWTFESTGHNVTAKAGASEKVRVPEGAEPFASYEGDRHFAIEDVGTTYEHTFTVAGEYVYVCEPHEDQGMVGTVVVTE